MVVELVLSIYAASLATIELIYLLLQNRRKVIVTMNACFAGPDLLNSICLDCYNAGSRPVTLTSYGIEYNDEGDHIFFVNQFPSKFPTELSEGEKCTVGTQQSVINKVFLDNQLTQEIKVKAYFLAAPGKKYRSKPFKYKFHTKEYQDG